jgi:pyruvate dehydrogenase E1 component alpha subunit
MVAWAVDGMDVLAVRAAVQRALALIRGGGGPCFLELRTYRFRAHSMYDPDRYRDKAEVERWRAADPIPALTAALVEQGGLTQDEVDRWVGEIDEEIAAAVEFADASPLEPVADLTRFVTSERGAG